MPKITSPHDYQFNAIVDTFNSWLKYHKNPLFVDDNGKSTFNNVLLVAPTGAGKTIIKAFTVKYWLEQNPDKFAVIFAHRDVLLSQISLAAASIGLPHKMICAKATEKAIGDIHMDELGESFLSDGARIIIASVPTWIKRNTTKLCVKVGLWCMDETHHQMKDNMWGKAVENLSHAYGLGVTATPLRTDGKGLGIHNDGLYHSIVKTPGMGELIEMGRLAPYKVYSLPSKLDMTGVNITASGEYNQTKLAKATDKPGITGDAVKHYLELAKGKQGIIFAASIKHAEHVAQQFRNAGINAVALSSKTNTTDRQHAVNDFRKGRITLLVNYDLFGEGFDVPAVEVVIMLRKTMSYGLFKQMFGRCLRVLDGKEYGILIDHVGNVPEHCLVGKHLHEDPKWHLERSKKKKSNDGEEGLVCRVCPKCLYFYLPLTKSIKSYICPDCGHNESTIEIIAAQKQQQINAGVLVEYNSDYLNEILAKRRKVDKPVEILKQNMSYAGMSNVVINSTVIKHTARQNAQTKLRPWIGEWCSHIASERGLDVLTTQAEFNRKFGIDVFKAQTISERESMEITDKIQFEMISKIFN